MLVSRENYGDIDILGMLIKVGDLHEINLCIGKEASGKIDRLIFGTAG